MVLLFFFNEKPIKQTTNQYKWRFAYAFLFYNTKMDLELQSHYWTDLLMIWIQKRTWRSRAIAGLICLWICMGFDTEMDVELQRHVWTDLIMNSYWIWYINGPGAPEPFLEWCAYEFVFDLIRSSEATGPHSRPFFGIHSELLWSSRAISGLICLDRRMCVCVCGGG